MTDILSEAVVRAIHQQIDKTGFAIIAASETRRRLAEAAPGELAAFEASWNDLMVDTYMADGGRYRRRRHAVFTVVDEKVTRQPNQPHYQTSEYNPLNGGIERWFEPVTENVAHSPVLEDLFAACRAAFRLDEGQTWRAELHQFRIEANDSAGLPTPEGMHRDGVDWVCVLLIRRINLAEGTTSIAGPDGTSLGAFTLTHPFDAIFLDDHRVMHGVTAIHRLDPALPAYRDVLVLTFKARTG
jgi:hypothetical protein